MDKEKFKAFLEKEITRLAKATEDPKNAEDMRLVHWLRAQMCYAVDLLKQIEDF